MFFKISKLLTAVVLSVALLSCASTTTIKAVDQSGRVDRDVKIYMDGSLKGRGEIIYSDTKIVGSTTQVHLKKEGCDTNTFNLSRTEKLMAGALIGGLFIWIPLLWIMGYNPMHSYEFNCDR